MRNYKPKEVTIAGHKFSIVYKAMKDFGELDFDEHKIYISNKIKGEVLLDTIIHEGVHVMFALSGLGCILENVQEELEEALVRGYENIVSPFLKEQYEEFYQK